MKKTIIGIMIMAVAIMMTLSSAVFAANAITVTVSEGAKVGDTVTVTVNHPAGTSAGEYVVSYDTDKLTYTGSDKDNGGNIKVAFMDTDYKEVKTYTLTFTAKAEGSAKVEVKDAILLNTNGAEMSDVTATEAGKTVEIGKKDEVKPDQPVTPADPDATTPDTDKKDNNNASDKKEDNNDKTLTTLKDAKTGFDAMYIVYLAAAVLVAGGIVTVAKRK